MYAYCSSNPINCIDADGYDAIWIQEKDSAEGFGHSGLMVQNESGDWFFFYWGPADENAPITTLVRGTPTNYIFEQVTAGASDMQRIGGVVRTVASSTNADISGRAGNISHTFYFEGDYTGTYDYLDNILHEGQEEYMLLSNNCLQNTCTAFSQSDPRFCNLNGVIPNRSIFRVACLATSNGFQYNPWDHYSPFHNYVQEK